MPRQNRVNPFGELVATTAWGTLMGNRGCLHNERQQIRRPFQVKRWIICMLEFKGWHRQVMRPGYYTELFFLDEATALSAGHRPCAECSRQRFELFRDFWARANPQLAGGPKPFVNTIDGALHEERITPDKQKITYPELISNLPDGTFLTLEDNPQPYLLYQKALFPWSPEGYGQPLEQSPNLTVQVLTPCSVVAALSLGYPVSIHPTVLNYQVAGT